MLRHAIEDDMPRILEIEQATISPPWTHGGLLREINNTDAYFILATENIPREEYVEELILGFIIMRRVANVGELFQIAVDEEHRRRGIADDLMDASLAWARYFEVTSIYLEVRKSNDSAIKLYKKHGFKKLGKRKGYYTEPVEDALVMVLNLE